MKPPAGLRPSAVSSCLGGIVLDPALLDGYRGSFDVLAAMAVFEHLRDIRSGMAAALSLLRGRGRVAVRSAVNVLGA